MYLAQLNHALDASQAAIPGALEDRYRIAVLVYSEDEPTRTVQLLEQWLRGKGFQVVLREGTGGLNLVVPRDDDEEMEVSGDGLHAEYLISSELAGVQGGADDCVLEVVGSGKACGSARKLDQPKPLRGPA